METHHPSRGRKSARFHPALIAFLLIAVFFLLSEHRAHFFGILPYLLLLACPFLHLFMHRGHDGEAGSTDQTKENHQPSIRR
ncbi:DUF2933 domain-containing protein [Candidatus Manganitrophus noduliformans]|uniref:DUF2933 domain-containing protein n=1 Tax=Candidatus Manganitrophus noduliformans TaxID=2606439 RepID=A0A7X6ICL9_9BACT|nr:DUF2933 domain-containing protein [Candidatus Manganitrophus noduliformans]NKE72666.1 DUF2933 domain-containing protein [Candidatus Manganitrophus noduliformans]